MQKLLFAASVLALAISPAVTSSAHAASAKSPYCNMAKGQKNLVAWNSYYHCLGPAPQAAQVPARTRRTAAAERVRSREGRGLYAQAQPERKSPYCNMAKGQKNLVAWTSYYHCLNR